MCLSKKQNGITTSFSSTGNRTPQSIIHVTGEHTNHCTMKDEGYGKVTGEPTHNLSSQHLARSMAWIVSLHCLRLSLGCNFFRTRPSRLATNSFHLLAGQVQPMKWNAACCLLAQCASQRRYGVTVSIPNFDSVDFGSNPDFTWQLLIFAWLTDCLSVCLLACLPACLLAFLFALSPFLSFCHLFPTQLDQHLLLVFVWRPPNLLRLIFLITQNCVWKRNKSSQFICCFRCFFLRLSPVACLEFWLTLFFRHEVSTWSNPIQSNRIESNRN